MAKAQKISNLEHLFDTVYGQAAQQRAFAVRVANQAAKEARQDWHQRSPFPPETKKVKHVESKVVESNPLPQSHHLLYGGGCEE